MLMQEQETIPGMLFEDKPIRVSIYTLTMAMFALFFTPFFIYQNSLWLQKQAAKATAAIDMMVCDIIADDDHKKVCIDRWYIRHKLIEMRYSSGGS